MRSSQVRIFCSFLFFFTIHRGKNLAHLPLFIGAALLKDGGWEPPASWRVISAPEKELSMKVDSIETVQEEFVSGPSPF
jgi:hypothetical protein